MQFIKLDENKFINVTSICSVERQIAQRCFNEGVGNSYTTLTFHMQDKQMKYILCSDWEASEGTNYHLKYNEYLVTPERLQAIEALLNSISV